MDSFSVNVLRLEQHLNEVESEKNAFEKDIKTYEKENKFLKEQISHLHASLNDADSKAMKTLKDIQELHHTKVQLLEDNHRRLMKEKDGRICELFDSIRNLKQELEECKQLDKENQFSQSRSDRQISALKDRVNQLQKESATQETQLTFAENEQKKKASQQQVRITVLEDQLKTVRSEKRIINDELVETKLKLNSLKSNKDSEFSKQEDDLKSMQSQLKVVQQSLRKKSGEIEETKNEQKKKVSQQQVRITVLEDQLKTIRSEKRIINDELVETKLKLNSIKSKKTSDSLKQEDDLKLLQKQIKILQEDLKDRSNAVDELSQRFKQSEISNRSLKKKIQDQTVAKDDEITQLSTKLHDKDGEICSLNNRITSLEKKDERVVSKHSARIERLQTELNQMSSETCSKDEKIRKYKRELEFAQSELRSKDAQHQITVSSLEKKVASLRNENRQKDEELCSVTRKLSNLESDSESKTFKEKIHQQALEEKTKKLEAEIKLKNEELSKTNSQLNARQIEVDSLTSQKNTLLESLRDKVSKLEKENKKKEDELCKVSSKLASSEVEVGSVSSGYRVRVRTLEEKLTKIQEEVSQKENSIIKLETQLADKDAELQSMKTKVARLEIVARLDGEKRKHDNKLQDLELEIASKSEENRKVQNEKRKLEGDLFKLKSELSSTTDKIFCLESEITELKSTLSAKERSLQEAVTNANKSKENVALKLANEQNLQCKVNSLVLTNQDLKKDLEQARDLKENLVVSIEDLTEKLKKSEKESKILQEASTRSTSKLNRVDLEQKSTIELQKSEVSELSSAVNDLEKQIIDLKNENIALEEKCKSLQVQSSVHMTTMSQLEEYKEQLDKMQKQNSKLNSDRDNFALENKELKRKLDKNENQFSSQASKEEEMAKTIDLLKESCLMLEHQVEDLESFNNILIEKQNELTAEKDEGLKKCSELRMELKTAQHEMKAELNTLDQCSNDQITDLKVELRNEMNQLHEVSEQCRDLEQKYKNLELHAAALQRKLNAEKDGRDRCLNELERLRADKDILQQSLQRNETNLHMEIDHCDMLEREKTQLLNRIDTEKLSRDENVEKLLETQKTGDSPVPRTWIKYPRWNWELEFSHELVRLNCQGQQQAKLIDFLQSRVEELEPDKKKKKKKTTLYQAPLQYRELRDLLEEEKSSNVKLQEQVNTLRSELQSTNSKVKRLKHGIDVPLSPGSIAAISAIVRSPATTSTDGALSPNKGGKLRSKPRMQHNIPHRLSTWVCHRATRCSVCLATILFGHSACRCSECAVVCHTKCKRSIVNTCGLPGGLFQHFREAPKPTNMSPITCVFKGNNSDQLQGKLKVLCGDDTWVIRSVRITSGHLRIAPPSAKSSSKPTDKDDVINLKEGAYVHTDLSQSELPNTTRQDLSYAFKIQSGSSNSCWPARSVYFLAAGFSEKHMWVERLEEIIAEENQSKTIGGNTKIFGNQILTMLNDEKVELNCSLPISDKTILFGCDEGLYQLSPSTSNVSSRADMKRVDGISCVYQLTALNKSTVLAIEGHKHKLVSFQVSSVVPSNSVTTHSIEDIEGCHLFAVGHAEGLPYLCVASASSITFLKFNDRLKKFCKKKEIATTEPCTCMVFTACSVIIGSNTFYEADLTEFKTDEFLEEGVLDQYGSGDVFPISILKIRDHEGRQEFLLCFHEFGIFVDGFGRQTRSGRLMWSRMPLSFDFRSPYLIVIQFNSIEILLLDVESSSSAENCKLDRAYLSFPKARYLGSAITEGALYLSSFEGNRTSVFCCKGNMKGNQLEPKVVASKRQYAALSSSLDSLSSPTTKRSTIFSDLSTMRSSTRILSKSEQSITSDTSRWMSTSADIDDVTGVSGNPTASENENTISSMEETTTSDSTMATECSRLQWRPAKTPPAKPPRGRYGSKFDPVSSTQV